MYGSRMRDVSIIGAGITNFGKLDKDLIEIATESSLRAINDSNLEKEDFDAVYFANMASGAFNNQTAVASALTDRLSLVPADAHRVENGPASGGSALRSALTAVGSGMQDLVLVTGAEKMTGVSGERASDILASMNHPKVEYKQGVTMTGMGGMYTRLYMEEFGVSGNELAAVSVKNHDNARKNPKAHFHDKRVTKGEVKNSKMIADPLRLYHISPVSDGAASLVVCPSEMAEDYVDRSVKIMGSGQATDFQSLEERKDPLLLESVGLATEEALEMAGVNREEIDVIETHDAFATLELAELEAAGFFEFGEAGKATTRGVTSLQGDLPVNPSGGLKARGHPVGATGVAQVVELFNQINGTAGKRQVENADLGFCCNFGGFGNNTVVHVLKRG